MKEFKKIKLTGLIIIVLGTLLFSSCSSTPESMKAIPKETNLVTAVDIFSIAQKGKLYEFSDLKVFKTIRKELKNENKKMADLADNLIEDPTISGINFTKDVFVYYLNSSKDEQFTCISAELSDEVKFTEFVENIIKENEIEIEMETKDNIKYYVLGKVGFGWDQDKMVFIAATNYKSRENIGFEIENILSLKDENQITANADFNNFYADKKDVSLWLNTDILEDVREFKRASKEFDIDITGNQVLAYLDFGSDEINLTSQFIPNESIKALMDENNVFDNSFNSDLMSYLPENNFGVVSLSMNPTAMYKMIEKQQEDEVEKFNKEYEKNIGISLEKQMESIGGSFVLSMFDFAKVNYTAYDYYTDKDVEREQVLPILGLALDINNNEFIKDFISKIPETQISKTDDYYEFKFEGKYPVYFAYNENICLFTNGKECISSFKDGGYSDNLSSSDAGSKISDSYMYASVNLDFDTYPDIIKKELTKHNSDNDNTLLSVWNELAKNIEWQQTENNTVIITLKMKDGDNTLNTLITAIDDNYKLFSEI